MYLLIKKLKAIEAPKVRELKIQRLVAGYKKTAQELAFRNANEPQKRASGNRTQEKIGLILGVSGRHAEKLETVFDEAAKPDSPPEVKIAAEKVNAGGERQGGLRHRQCLEKIARQS